MTAAEARKKQWESLKDKPLTDRLKYIFTYYWPGIVGGLCVLIFLVSWICNILTQPDVILSGHLVNGVSRSSYEGNLQQDFMALQQLDSKEYSFTFTADTGMASGSPVEVYDSMNALVTRIAVGEIDFLISELESFQTLSAYHTDLRTVLTEAQLEKYQDLLVYVETAELEALLSDDVETIVLPEYYMSAEGLTDPLPIGIRLPENCRLLQAYSFPEGEVIFSITRHAQHLDKALEFLEYILV